MRVGQLTDLQAELLKRQVHVYSYVRLLYFSKISL